MPSPKKIRVLVVDDSSVARRIITDSLVGEPDIEVVGTAIDPYVARDKILALNPDVLTLDIEMPRMDGLTFLRVIMKHRPMPVIIMSSLTSEGSNKAMEAMEAGAVDVMCKPSGSYSAFADGTMLAGKIRAAAQARIGAPAAAPAALPSTTRPARIVGARMNHARNLIVMGASTGGTEALKVVLRALPGDLPPIAIVQHIPAQFSLAFAKRLNELCAFEVREARHGDELRPGLALVAPGGQHLLVRWTGSHYVAALNEGPPVHHQRPAVDVLFDSVVKAGGAQWATGVVMTGMGADGAAGLLNLRRNGAATLAQSEATCVVFGMPREAIRMGAAQKVVDLDRIAPEIERLSRHVQPVEPAGVAA